MSKKKKKKPANLSREHSRLIQKGALIHTSTQMRDLVSSRKSGLPGGVTEQMVPDTSYNQIFEFTARQEEQDVWVRG